jgi:hypothetical protein
LALFFFFRNQKIHYFFLRILIINLSKTNLLQSGSPIFRLVPEDLGH